MNILVTGATGFIGSNIAKYLVKNNHYVIATYRSSSSFRKCERTKDNILWVNTENANWKELIIKIRPVVLIHSAWGGIEAADRNNWEFQLRNFKLSKEYFDLAEEAGINKIIALGSQAEYGRQIHVATEESQLQPDDAYGAVKTLTANYLRAKFHNSPISWYWIRVFSLFGEYENDSWLMPSVINKLLKNESIALTACEQKYNYLYINDFVKQLNLVIEDPENKSGVYNICNNKATSIKEILYQIVELMGKPKELLHVGQLPYRQNQNMFIHGSNQKFCKVFNVDLSSGLGIKEGLKHSIEFHKNQQK
ncbi:NAD-dependent epimerase/dehydratase family protein [Mangrovibacterium lignilyticum]|uniref:NAD-dependent epimerase/dehydratase family protein n=1 Tax=Mangrovibacterium lignilyticum TaxID=2668052 RepID=UPI0013D65185|nr:NAD(P)-dependent oxidoreductase [Mangrovibacterium lignilyticum]